MKISISADLKTLSFWAIGKEIPKVTGGSEGKYGPEVLIHTFENPKLLVDNAAIMRLSSVKRDLIMRLLEFPWRIVEYDGVSAAWSDAKYPGVWAPSIDTILFAKALRTLFQKSSFYTGIKSFLEIGCGSGFLSKYILKKKIDRKKPADYAHLMDINRDALLCSMDNIDEVRGNTLISYTWNQPQKSIKVAQKYDLVICNPPYISRPHTKANNPFEGLFLYGEILRQANTMLKPDSKLLTNFSSISKSDVYPEFAKVFTMRTINRLRVPFKLPLLTAEYSDESRYWMQYLLRNHKLMIDATEKLGHRYWHEIEIVECRLRT